MMNNNITHKHNKSNKKKFKTKNKMITEYKNNKHRQQFPHKKKHRMKLTKVSNVNQKYKHFKKMIRLKIGKNNITKPTKAQTKIQDRKSTRLNSSHVSISYAVFC